MHHMHSLRTETSIARIKLRMSEDGIATLSSSCLALFKNVDFLHRTILAMKYRQLHQWAELAGIIIKLNRRLEAIALRGDVSNESSQMANLYTACIASVDDRDNKIGSSTDTLSKWDTIIRLRRIACFLNDRDRVEARMAQIGVDYFPTELPIIPLSAIAKDIETFRVHCSHLIDGGALSTTTRSRRSSAKYKRSAVQANAFALELLDKVLLTQSFISSGHNGIDCLNPTFCITIHNTDFAIATLKKVSCEGDNSSESRVWRALLYMGVPEVVLERQYSNRNKGNVSGLRCGVLRVYACPAMVENIPRLVSFHGILTRILSSRQRDKAFWHEQHVAIINTIVRLSKSKRTNWRKRSMFFHKTHFKWKDGRYTKL